MLRRAQYSTQSNRVFPIRLIKASQNVTDQILIEGILAYNRLCFGAMVNLEEKQICKIFVANNSVIQIQSWSITYKHQSVLKFALS